MKFIRDPIIDSSGKVTGLLFFAIKEALIPANKPPAAAAAHDQQTVAVDG